MICWIKGLIGEKMSFEYFTLVANAVIHRDGQVLIGKKVEGPHPVNLGGKWHFPGGRVELGETPAQAIIREMKEETGLNVEIKRMFDAHMIRQVVKGKRGICCFVWFLVEPKDSKTPMPADDLQEVKWVSKKEAMTYFPDNFLEHIPWNVKEFLLEG
jgi:8-oxo-dGTP diphosphatase